MAVTLTAGWIAGGLLGSAGANTLDRDRDRDRDHDRDPGHGHVHDDHSRGHGRGAVVVDTGVDAGVATSAEHATSGRQLLDGDWVSVRVRVGRSKHVPPADDDYETFKIALGRNLEVCVMGTQYPFWGMVYNTQYAALLLTGCL